MFGQPTVPCGSRTLHPWHSDGRAYCPGIRQDDLTPTEAGVDLETAVPVALWEDLDALARSFGTVADWYADADAPNGHRQFITSPNGVQYVGPGRHNATHGGWVLAGDTRERVLTGDERRADEAADRYYDRP